MTTNGKTCGTCKHWHKQQSMDLSQQKGECRESLHASTFATPQGIAQNAFYPSVPARFPCCSHYAAMVVRSLELRE
jgi:hypothetical protein